MGARAKSLTLLMSDRQDAGLLAHLDRPYAEHTGIAEHNQERPRQ